MKDFLYGLKIHHPDRGPLWITDGHGGMSQDPVWVDGLTVQIWYNRFRSENDLEIVEKPE